jgi:nucleoid-associated protein YgaU
MGYDFYMGNVLLPVAPKKLQIKVNGNNKTVTLINEGEVNILKTVGLTDIDFEILLPYAEHSFASYKDGFQPIEYYLNALEKMKKNREIIQFIVTRLFPSGKSLYSTNIKVTLEDYTIKEDVDVGLDTVVSVRLKQYRDYGTKTYGTSSGKITSVSKKRTPGKNEPKKKTYTVKSGDSLWKIAASLLGDGSKWNKIYEANKTVIGGNPNLIKPGQVLTIPS